MSLEKIVSKIEADSLAAEQAILQEAAKYRNEQHKLANQRKAEIMAEYKSKADNAIAQLSAREEAGLEMELKKSALASRKRTLDRAFESVLEHFRNLPASEKKKLYQALMARVTKEIPTGKIRPAKKEESLFSSIGAFKLGEPINCIGGFIAESPDGKLEMDMRFEVLLKDIWDHNLSEISALLFSNGEKE